jgi:hypothetical protein
LFWADWKEPAVPVLKWIPDPSRTFNQTVQTLYVVAVVSIMGLVVLVYIRSNRAQA